MVQPLPCRSGDPRSMPCVSLPPIPYRMRNISEACSGRHEGPKSIYVYVYVYVYAWAWAWAWTGTAAAIRKITEKEEAHLVLEMMIFVCVYVC